MALVLDIRSFHFTLICVWLILSVRLNGINDFEVWLNSVFNRYLCASCRSSTITGTIDVANAAYKDKFRK